MYYTLGQRQGLGIGGSGSGEPWFVVDKDLHSNTLIVAQGEQHPRLYSFGLIVRELHWIGTIPDALQNTTETFTCTAKFRYRQPDQDVTIHRLPDGTFSIAFHVPQRSITPGQSVVLYDGEVCLGGGIIEEALKNGQPYPFLAN
jgi:tRNA-specific 2-thiouridylase